MYDQETTARDSFKAVRLDRLEWETVPGDGQKPGYSEAVIESDTLYALHWLAPVDMDLSISIRKYPRRYFLAVSIFDDPESEGEPFVDIDDLDLGVFAPIVSVILYRMDHAEFAEVFSELMGNVYDWLNDKDLQAIHLITTLKALRP